MEQATTVQTVDRAWLGEFLDRWAAAWNSHQREHVLELVTDDIVYDDSAWPETMRGKPAVREFIDYTWRAFPDLVFEAVGSPLVAHDEPRSATWWRGSATNTGPIDPPGFPATGRRIQFEGGDFHEYRDGKIARLQIVFDMMDVGRQLGLFPQPGSTGERALAAAQQLKARVLRR